MKKSRKLFFASAFAIGFFSFFSCTDESQIERAEYVNNIRVTGEDPLFEPSLTRTSYTSNLQFSWSLGDTLGIYPIGGTQVDFPISSGDGSKTAAFDGGAWALRASYQYAGYFPFSGWNFHNSQEEIPVSYKKQQQDGENSMANLGHYDYMASAATSPNPSGGVNLAMKRLGCFMRLQLTIPTPCSLTSVKIESDGQEFTTAGTIDLTASTPAITAKETAPYLSMKLDNVSTSTNDQQIILWMMSAPANLLGSTLTISATTNTGTELKSTVAGKNMVANGGYGYTTTLASVETGATGEDPEIDFGDEDNNIILQLNAENFGFGIDPTDCLAGTIWGSTSFGTFYNAYSTQHRAVDCNTHGYNQVVFNGEHTIYTLGGIQGMDNPKDIDGGNPGVTLTPPDSGAVIGFTATKNGYVYIVVRLSSNKNYHVFEEGHAIGFTIAMEIDDDRFPNKVLSYSVEGEGEYNEVTDPAKTDWPVRVILNDVEAASAGNGLGVIGFQVFEGLTYLVGAGGSKIAWCGAYTTDEPATSIVLKGDIADCPVEDFTLIGQGSIPEICYHNGHQYVDLGIKDAQGRTIYWARCNVGARKPEDYGDYFAWGETTTKSSYDWSTYKYCNGSYTTLNKYNNDSSYGIVDNKTVLELENDAAHVNWGGNWRMPTSAELNELLRADNCTWTWTNQNGVIGYKVTSKKNGNSLFLPAAGFRIDSTLISAGLEGSYWSSLLYTSSPSDAYYLILNPGFVDWGAISRSFGKSVRPVLVLDQPYNDGPIKVPDDGMDI